MLSAMVCDDRHDLRRNLVRFLSSSVGVSHVWQVGYADLVTAYARRPVEVVFIGAGVDSDLIASARAIKDLARTHAHAHAIVFGGSADLRRVSALIRVGAAGFLRWPVGSSPEADTKNTLLGTQEPSNEESPHRAEFALTQRETQMLHGMSRGMTNADIARALHLSEDTVKTHVRRLFHTLDVVGRAQAVAQGFRHTLIQ
jgi:DNA-binding NarL/FixJ family response regulator